MASKVSAFLGRLVGWRMIRRGLFIFACVVTFAALFYAEENWRGRRAWNAYVREHTAKGESLDSASFLPPPVPDDQNLALCPLLRPVLDYDPKEATPWLRWHDTNGLNRLRRLDLYWSVKAYHDSAPLTAQRQKEQADMFARRYGNMSPSKSPNATAAPADVPGEMERRQAAAKEIEPHLLADLITNGWINLPLLQAYFRTGTNLDGAGAGNSAAQNVLLALRYCEPDLAELEREAARRPLTRWPVKYHEESSGNTLLPHLSECRRIIYTLRVRSAARLAAGDSAGGLADIQLCLRLAESIREEPFLTCQLVRGACLRLTLQPLREALARRQLSDAQLAEVQRSLAAIDLLEGYARVERSGRADAQHFGRVFEQWIKSGELETYWPESGTNAALRRLTRAYRSGPAGWIYQNQLALCRLQDRFLLSAVDVRNHRVDPQVGRGLNAAVAALPKQYSLLSVFVFEGRGPLNEACDTVAQSQTELDEAVVACALERYRLAHGQYPETLDALAPFIEKLPHDLINGEPLKYRRTEGDHFLLYSVGWNEKDEGGLLVASGSNPEWPSTSQGDWVWRQPGQ